MMYYRQALKAEARTQIRALQVVDFPHQANYVRRGLIQSYQRILNEGDTDIDQRDINVSWDKLRSRRVLHAI